MQSSITTNRPASRARSAAASSTTPSCIQIARAPTRIAASPAAYNTLPVVNQSRASPHADRGVHNFRHKFRSPEYVHNVNLFGNVFQPGIGFFAQHFLLIWIYRNDPITGRLHILRDAVTRAETAG